MGEIVSEKFIQMERFYESDIERQSLTGNALPENHKPNCIIQRRKTEESEKSFSNGGKFKSCKRRLAYVVSSLLVLAFLLVSTTFILKTTGSGGDEDSSSSANADRSSSSHASMLDVNMRVGTEEISSGVDETVAETWTAGYVETNTLEGSAVDDEDLFEFFHDSKKTSTSTTTTTTTLPRATILDDIEGEWEQIRAVNLDD